jgi:hypothetical protein
MIRPSLAAAALLAVLPLSAEAASKTRFWNLTGDTITKLEMAPAGTTDWGPDQCKNDKDGAVDNDERLAVTVAAGTYDVRLTQKARVCVVKGIKVEDGQIFSIEADQLKDCVAP